MSLALRPSPQVVAVEVGDETVLYDPVGDSLHLLDRVAAAVWSQLDGRRSVHALSRRMAARTNTDVRRVEPDVRALLDRLQGAGVVHGDRPVPLPRDPVVEDAPGEPWAAVGAAPPVATPFATGSFQALGHVFSVASNIPDLCPWLDTVLVDLAAPRPTEHRYTLLDLGPGRGDDRFLLAFDGRCVARSGWLPRLLDLFLWHVNTEAVERSAGELVLVHAAAAARHGAAVLLPAASTHGKSTTVAGLVRAGWDYVTDEIVALDPSSLGVVGYPRPICLDRGSWGVLPELRPSHAELVTGQWQVPASHVRPDAVVRRALPAAVVAPRYDPQRRTGLERMSPGEVVLALADSTLAFRHDPARNLGCLARLATAVPAFRLTVSRLDHAVDLVEAAVACR